MAQVLIRNLEDDIVDRLKRKAADAGISLEAYLRKVVTESAGQSHGDVLAEIERLRLTVPPPKAGEARAEDLVRGVREERTEDIERRSKS